MSTHSSLHGVKRTSKSKVVLRSPSLLRLEIPPKVDTSLPVWDAISSQHVDVTWSLKPGGLSIHLTPKTSVPPRNEKYMGMFAGSAERPSTLPPPPTLGQAGAEPHVASPSDSLLALSGATNGLAAALNLAPTPTVAPPLPRYRTRSQTKKLALSALQTPMSTSLSPFPDPPPFHTRSGSDVGICDKFLVGSCCAGQTCLMHHTPFPYHWQLFCTLTRKWVSFPSDSQVILEQNYCNVATDAAQVQDGKTGFTLDFQSMEVVSLWNYSSVRRLSTLKTDLHFPSKLRIYWLKGSEWKKYDEVMTRRLLEVMDKKEPKVYFFVGSKEHVMDFTTMTQTNTVTGYNRKVRCRPLFRSPESMQPHLRTFFFSNPSMPAFDPSVAHFNVNPLVKFSSWYPPVWGPALEEDFRLIEVPVGMLAHQSVQNFFQNFFHRSLAETKVDVVSIHQVQNLLHWDKYQRHKVHMQKRHTTKTHLERHLFHGTNKDAAEGICQNNFDPRMYNINGYVLGKGSYFTPSASNAHHYTLAEHDGLRHMFLAKVLVGQTAVGLKYFYHPPPLSPTQKHHLFDSCVDQEYKPQMFVVFDSCQCYPYYLIKYKERTGVVSV